MLCYNNKKKKKEKKILYCITHVKIFKIQIWYTFHRKTGGKINPQRKIKSDPPSHTRTPRKRHHPKEKGTCNVLSSSSPIVLPPPLSPFRVLFLSYSPLSNKQLWNVCWKYKLLPQSKLSSHIQLPHLSKWKHNFGWKRPHHRINCNWIYGHLGAARDIGRRRECGDQEREDKSRLFGDISLRCGFTVCPQQHHPGNSDKFHQCCQRAVCGNH